MRWLPLVLLAACGPGSSETDGACDTAPVVTWESFGEGFLLQHCQPCHASTATERHGAPEDVYFDTEKDVAALADLIVEVATGDDPRMPPGGGVSDADRERLRIWLSARCSGSGRKM